MPLNDEKFETFTKVEVANSKKLTKPIGILALDVDLTLIDKKGNYQYKDETIKLIKYAFENNVLVAIVSGRFYEGEKEITPTISTVINGLCPEYISWIYYTNSLGKEVALRDLATHYLSLDLKDRRKICLVDDQLIYRKPCEQDGFQTIRVVTNNPDYIKSMVDFIDERVFLSKAENAKDMKEFTLSSVKSTKITAKMLEDLINFNPNIDINPSSPDEKNDSALLCAIKQKNYDKTKCIFDHLKHPLSHNEILFFNTTKDKSARKLYLQYKVNQYIEYETKAQDSSNMFVNYYLFRRNKIRSAQQLQRYLANENFDNFKYRLIYRESHKLSKLYKEVMEFKPRSKVK